LIKEQDDIGYRSSRDAAIATFIWVLNETQPDLAQVVIATTLNAPRLWWARKVAFDAVRRQSTVPQNANTMISGGEQRSANAPRELLVISQPAENAIVEGRFIDIENTRTESREPQVETSGYSRNTSSSRNIVVDR